MRDLCISSSILVAVALSQLASADEGRGDGKVGVVRSAALQVLNNTNESKRVPSVHGVSKLPISLEIEDEGSGFRRLQVFVSVHEQPDPAKPKPGMRVKTHRDEKKVVSEKPGKQTSRFDTEIKLPPGRYVFCVFLCDPDKPARIPKNSPDFFPNEAELPGTIYAAKACLGIVD